MCYRGMLLIHLIRMTNNHFCDHCFIFSLKEMNYKFIILKQVLFLWCTHDDIQEVSLFNIAFFCAQFHISAYCFLSLFLQFH